MDFVKLLLVICMSAIYVSCLVAKEDPCKDKQCEGDKVCEVHQGHPMCVPVRSNPDVCKEPLKVGPCKQAITRFYYNAETHSCQSFSWGGCDPNGNNFKSFVKCVHTCGQFKG